MTAPREGARRGGCLAGLVLCVVAIAAAPGIAAEELLRFVGTLPLEASDAVAVDPVARHIITIHGRPARPLTLAAFDDEDLSPVRKVQVSGSYVQNFPKVYAVDAAGRLLYLVTYRSDAPLVQPEETAAVLPHVMAVDLDTFEVVRSLPVPAFPHGLRVYGMALSEGRLWVVMQRWVADLRNAPGPLVLVGALDPESGAFSYGPAPLPGCRSVIADDQQAAVARVGDSVFVGCRLGGVASAPRPAVAELRLAEGTTRLFSLPGSYERGGSYFDAEAGRLVLSAFGLGHGDSVWVFDVGRRMFVGQIGADVTGTGLDADGGRVYIKTRDTVFVTTARGVEIDQGLPFRLASGGGGIWTIPFSRSIAIRLVGGRDGTVAVFRDLVPDGRLRPVVEADFASYDRLATPEPQFSGVAQAFGMRVRHIGGIEGAAQSHVFVQDLNLRHAKRQAGINDGNRELYAARVIGAALTDGEASAIATSLDADETARADHEKLAGPWPAERAACADFGSEPRSAEVEGARVSCRRADGLAGADAFHEAATTSAVTIGSARAEAHLRLDPGDGLLVRSRAEARDVTIGDAVRIGRVVSEATASAFGRAGSARASYDRTLHHVTIDGRVVCGEDCAEHETIAEINAALGAPLEVSLPEADLTATPGGAHAHAQRDAWGHRQDVALSGQDPREMQVAGLRIVVNDDGAVSHRTIVELGATMTGATFFPLGAAAGPAAAGRDAARPGATLVPAGPAPSAATEPAKPGATGGVREITRRVAGAWRWIFRRPEELLLSGLLWSLFGVPLLLGTRRRHLQRLAGGRA